MSARLWRMVWLVGLCLHGLAAAEAPALLVLDTTAKNGALSVSGESKLIVKRGGLVVNSSHPQGAVFNALSTILAAGGGAVGVVGKYQAVGKATCMPEPTPCEPAANPFATLKLPPLGEQVYSRQRIIPDGQRQTLRPGVYRGGILVGKGAELTLAPGVFQFVDGDFSSLAATITGEGVCLVFTGKTPGACQFHNDAKVKLSAPAEGELAGLVVVSEHADAALSFNGCKAELNGTVYAPKGRVQSLFKADASISRVVSLHVMLNVEAKLVITGDRPKPPPPPPAAE